MTTGDPAKEAAPRETPAGQKSIVGSMIGGRYRIEKLLGEGGMGAVYQAEHTLMHKRVALKVLHPEMSQMDEVVARFEREAMAAAHIEHPNVAAATDFGKLDDGAFFLVLEFVEGKSLREAITKGPMPIPVAVHVARQIAGALTRAHGLGIVHRDLKPENVMLVERDGDAHFVKVLDFGIAKVPVGEIAPQSKSGAKALTQAGMVYGTPEYMAPEQALGQAVDQRADMYSLGIMLYEMITGARPFDDESKVKLLGMHLTAAVPPMAERGANVPPELETLVMRMLAKEASDRPQEAKEIADALDAFAGAVLGATDMLVRTSSPVLPVGSSPRLSVTSSASLPSLSSSPSLRSEISPSPPATSPTVLALSPQVGSFFRGAVRRVPPKVLYAAIAVVGVLAIVVPLVVVPMVSHSSQGASSSSADAPSPTLTKKPAHFDQEIKKAQAEIGAGQVDAAITRVGALVVEAPDRPEPHHVLYQAYTAKGDTKSAFSEAGLWLGADPAAQRDTQLQSTVRTAATSRGEDSDAAFDLLESGKMGPPGTDILYDLAYGTSSAGPVVQRARRSLARIEVQKHASPALQITLDLRSARDCGDKRALLDQAATTGDARTLAVLESYQTRGGCGFLGTRDCYGCLRKDNALDQTIDKLRARISR
ncbi:MAG TPA: serine/threonine-protein kinase [Polyangiaceae bacterium]|nr:serine/threonine-protein kinase [Polyangiaceae bacterium]